MTNSAWLSIGFVLLVASCSSFEGDSAKPAADGGASSTSGSSGAAERDWTTFKCQAESHDLCDDMDEGDVGKDPPWSKPPSANIKASFEQTTTTVRSPPRALRVTSSPAYGVSLTSSIRTTIHKLSCDVDIRVEKRAGGETAQSYIDVEVVPRDPPVTSTPTPYAPYEFSLIETENLGLLVRSASTNTTGTNAFRAEPFALDTWEHVHFEITPAEKVEGTDAGTGQPLLLQIGSTTKRFPAAFTFTDSTAVSASITIGQITRATGAVAVFDNFFCDAE